MKKVWFSVQRAGLRKRNRPSHSVNRRIRQISNIRQIVSSLFGLRGSG